MTWTLALEQEGESVVSRVDAERFKEIMQTTAQTMNAHTMMKLEGGTPNGRYLEVEVTKVLAQSAAQAPRQDTLAVFHSEVLAYADRQARREFVQVVSELPGHWVSNEGWRVLPDQEDAQRQVPAHFALGLDGQVV